MCVREMSLPVGYSSFGLPQGRVAIYDSTIRNPKRTDGRPADGRTDGRTEP